MKKILFLALHRPNRSPSQRFRFEQYLKYLNHEGFSYDFSFLISEYDDTIFYSKGSFLGKSFILLKSTLKRVYEVLTANKYDIIFIQRECYMLGTSFFEKLFSLSKAKIIFDFDDSIWLNNVSEANKQFVWLKNPEKTSQIIKTADIVIAGNEYLAQYAQQYNQNVVIIPTTIDTDEYKTNNKTKINTQEKVCIGWSGSITTIQHFEYAIPFLEKIKEKYGEKVFFNIIGDKNYHNKKLNIKGKAWSLANEIAEISAFDIGVMPLPDDEWAKGKCGLKGLQYMALSVPTIMSPVGVNKEIINDGVNGYLASENEEWINKLTLLIESPQLRLDIGKNARNTVLNKYSCEANKNKYLEIFNRLAS